MSSNALLATVQALYIYPVKACAGQRVSSLQFSADGLITGDREWVVVNAAHEVVWQGSHPRLALVRPFSAAGLLQLKGPEGQALTLPDPPLGKACQVNIWNGSLQQNEVFDGLDAGDAAAAWLQQVTGAADLRLVRLDAGAWAHATVNPCHITSTASLAELNMAQTRQGLPTAAMERFRPNVVVTGASLEPFVEEYCTQLRWQHGNHAMAQLAVQPEPCIRCIVPNVDPVTAAVGSQTLETVTQLSAERHPGKPAYFGIYARAQQAATLQEGTPLELVLNF